jgi:hypothetical protein
MAERFGIEASTRCLPMPRFIPSANRELEPPARHWLFDNTASVVFTNPASATRRSSRQPNGSAGPSTRAISGDLPIVLAARSRRHEGSSDNWFDGAPTRRRRLKLDLVILEERVGEAADRLRAELRWAPPPKCSASPTGCSLTADLVPASKVLLSAAARCAGRRSRVTDRSDRQQAGLRTLGRRLASGHGRDGFAQHGQPPDGLSFWNGFGGFTPDGREYAIVIDGLSQAGPTLPPAPWTNVLANPGFGCLVTEAGLGYSWAGNSQTNRLSPWSNDPTSDPPGEAIYLRDEETGEFWTPTPLPLGPRATVTVRHGQGYTRFTHVSGHLQQDLLVFVPPDDPIKLVCLTVRNDDNRPRRLTATYYAEWVLGTARENAPLQVVCERDHESGAILARNAWSGDFAGKIAFVASGATAQSISADRTEFLGEHGSVSTPAAMKRVGLSGRASPALDPCAAVATEVTLSPGETRQTVSFWVRRTISRRSIGLFTSRARGRS